MGVGAEQMLLDMQSLRSLLLDLPSLGQPDKSSTSGNYTRFVTNTMHKAEMIPKVIMTPADDVRLFVEDFTMKVSCGSIDVIA